MQQLPNQKKYTDKIKCSVCDASYSRSNVSNHKKTKQHKISEQYINNIKDMILGSDKFKGLGDLVKNPYHTVDDKIIYLTDRQYKFYKLLPNNKLM